MRSSPIGNWLVILLTFVIALLLEVVPLPADWQPWRPTWALLCLIYWTMALPERIGLLFGWLLGLPLDVLHDVTLGQHGLALMVVSYIDLSLHQQLRLFPRVQQALIVCVLVSLYLLLLSLTQLLISQQPWRSDRLLSALSSGLLWPLLFPLLRRLRRHYRVE
ncbi:MAG TPA: rod shape-determining protein MreD [Pseudomonadales bacterium]|nr:rod shape-determining protein MreD [Pseudomonadales bacterium]